MKKGIFKLSIVVLITALTSFTVSEYIVKDSTAEVEKIEGYLIFAKSRPVKEYEHLGTIKGPTIGSHEFDKLVASVIKKVKKEYPKADAILFDGVIRQTHNTRVSAIKFK